MAYFQRLKIHVSVAIVLVLVSAATEVEATEFQGLKDLKTQVSDLAKRWHECSVSLTGMAEVPGELKDLKAQVEAMKNKRYNTASNLIPPVPGLSIDAAFKKVLEIDKRLSAMEVENKSLREAMEQMKRDMHSERLERKSSVQAVRAEARSVAELLVPEVKQTLVELPSMVAKMKRFFRTGRDVMQFLSPTRSPNDTADQDKLNTVQMERNSVAVPEEETSEPTNELDAEVNAAAYNQRGNVPHHSSLQKFEIGSGNQEKIYNSTIPTLVTHFAENDSYTQPNFTETALHSEALKNARYGNVSEIEFVGQERNFSISITDGKVTSCMEYGSNSYNISNSSTEPCDGFRVEMDFGGHGTGERMVPISDDFTKHRWSIENAIVFMAIELQRLRKRVAEEALNDRDERLEEIAENMMRKMNEMKYSIEGEMEQGLVNISVKIEEIIGVLTQYNLTHLEGTTQEIARNTSSLWESIHNAHNKMQHVQHQFSEAIESSNVGNNASFHLMKENLALSVSQLEALNKSLQRFVAERETVLKGKLEVLNSAIELNMRQLTETVQECCSAVEGLNGTTQGVQASSLYELSKNNNSSIASTEIKLQARMDDLDHRLLSEIEHLKEMMKMKSPAQLPIFSGWHPDDAADCPGLDVLATDDRLILSPHNSGRYRAPHLPSDPMPVGSVVRFRCVPAGSHKLIGAVEIRCLGAKRWSSKPPRCQPLLTLEQMMTGNKTDMTPSILYHGLIGDELASADDNDSLVVRPETTLLLKCLYPRQRGNVTWLHNGTVPRDATLAWAQEGPADLGENVYLLQINRTLPEHSGTYRCETPDGMNHSIKIKISDVTCQAPIAPENGHVDIPSAGGAVVGSTARFRCSLGYELHGPNESTCLGSGRWSELSKCQEIDGFSLPKGSCLRPVIPEEFSLSPDKDWYETGQRITYRCQGGKVLIGMPTATCHEGQWIGQNRRCL
ncbi:hypothetical protein MRX96_031833 [Rhipicephalus microplus]